MVQIGTYNKMKIDRVTKSGAFLTDGTPGEKGVLLPGAQIPDGAAVGDSLEVFIYRDSEDRPIATTKKPLVTLGQAAVMKVVQVNDIGAFLDWGLDKDLLLPFKEQRWKVRPGAEVFAALYTDKSGRLCATMLVDRFLSADSPYKKDDTVTGILYEINRDIGGFVAVDGKYFGLIPREEITRAHRPCMSVTARVARVRSDGKLVLDPRKKAYKQMEDDAESVMALIDRYGGKLPFTDKADPEYIKLMTGLTKNAFKRAVGRLYKEGRIVINDKTIEKI